MRIRFDELYTREEKERILEKYPFGEFNFRYVGFGLYELTACRIWEYGEEV